MNADLQRDLGRVEGKLDSLIETVRQDINERKARDREFEARVRKVENRQYYFMGGGAVIGALLSHLVSAVRSFAQ